MKDIDRIPGKSENDDMMIRFHHFLQKLYKGGGGMEKVPKTRAILTEKVLKIGSVLTEKVLKCCRI